LGAGEVLVTSIDREGERKGYDCGLIAAVAGAVDVPIIASGGYGSHGDLGAALSSGADAVAVADALHYGRRSVADLLAELEGVT
jgi:cyclase